MMRCGLLGRKLGHSYSPQLHGFFGRYAYELFEVEPEKLGEFLQQEDFHGLNVTIPYKKAVIPYCRELSPTARAIGSINTICRLPDGALYGENTDAAGFEGLLVRSGISPKGKKALVLGSGGASLTVCYVLGKLGAAEVVVISRSGENSYQNLDRHADAQLLVNTTPVGMYPNNGEAPVDLEAFPHCEGVVDLIYNPLRTKLLLEAEKRGIACMGGLFMLAEQARCAAEIFMGEAIPKETAQAATEKIREEKENLILVGMPGAGKSTVGRLLAEKLRRPFVDADQAAEEKLGMPVAAFLRQYGENAFRQAETAVLAQLGRQSGLVVATGGGCVTRAENYSHLRQNGVIVWLERNLADLPRAGRPLSENADLEAMYAVRRPLYETFADFTVENEVPAAAAEEILKNFQNSGNRRPLLKNGVV